MRNIYVMSGLPASGKSTYAESRRAPKVAVFHRDDFRQYLREQFGTTDYFPCSEKEEYRQWANVITAALIAAPDWDIYIDQTTLTTKAAIKLINAIKGALTPNDQVFFIVCHCALDICKERNAKREGYARVPEQTIDNMHKSMMIDPVREDALRHTFPGVYFGVVHTNETEG
jgi:predicted kinase